MTNIRVLCKQFFLRTLIFAILTNKDAEIKVHKKEFSRKKWCEFND